MQLPEYRDEIPPITDGYYCDICQLEKSENELIKCTKCKKVVCPNHRDDKGVCDDCIEELELKGKE